MSEAEHADLVAEFCSITDAAPSTAESFLAAHDWQLEGALNTFFHDPEPPALVAFPAAAAVPPAAQYAPAGAAGAVAAPGKDIDYVEILDDDEAGGAGLAELARQRADALAARQQAQQAQEDALAATSAGAADRGMQQGGAGPSGAASMDLADDVDLADYVAAAVAADAGDGHPPADVASYHRRQQEELLAMYQRQAAQQQQQAAAAGGAAGDPFADLDEEERGLAAIGVGLGPRGFDAAAPPALHHQPLQQPHGAEEPPLDLPEGINLEEARMLEAAMLGIPYAGRIPDFSAAQPAAAPLSPGTLEQHAIRREQDQAYEESLALDRAKQESAAAAAAQAEAAERAQREAEAAAEAEAARAAEELQQLLASKAARLPAEPAAGTPGSIQVVVRLPAGSRKGRRFLPSDPLQAVFDYVDVECAAASEGEGQGSCDIKPGSFRLVTQFPRKVYGEEGSDSSSLQDAGITTDTALFIEPMS